MEVGLGIEGATRLVLFDSALNWSRDLRTLARAWINCRSRLKHAHRLFTEGWRLERRQLELEASANPLGYESASGLVTELRANLVDDCATRLLRVPLVEFSEQQYWELLFSSSSNDGGTKDNASKNEEEVEYDYADETY